MGTKILANRHFLRLISLRVWAGIVGYAGLRILVSLPIAQPAGSDSLHAFRGLAAKRMNVVGLLGISSLKTDARGMAPQQEQP
ncbi:hypothetical protein B0E46_04915 [Rhodanobacter sp. B04]|nr:hypothetical protein B0E46_04915 [Rhodanobacter sp. B04]